MNSPPRLGSGRAYAEVIGDPIAQSKSPAIHGFWLGQLGLDAEYRSAHVTADALADYLNDRKADPDWRGCNVTMPHKQAVMPYLERLDPLAARIGAVNTIVRSGNATLAGFNTDAAGFLEPLQPLLACEHLFRMARVFGTGGAARAIVAALAAEHVVIVLAGRDPAKARALLDELYPGGEHHATDLAHFAAPTDFVFDDRVGCLDLIVNASPLGMAGQPPLAVDLSHARPVQKRRGRLTLAAIHPHIEGAWTLETNPSKIVLDLRVVEAKVEQDRICTTKLRTAKALVDRTVVRAKEGEVHSLDLLQPLPCDVQHVFVPIDPDQGPSWRDPLCDL